MAIAPESIGASAVDVEPTPRGVLSFAVSQGLKFVDLKFTDLPGTLQHFSVPLGEFGEEAFEEGVGFDGSSIRGFQQIEESDMLLVPDPATAIVAPIYEVPPPSLPCNLVDPGTREMDSRAP